MNPEREVSCSEGYLKAISQSRRAAVQEHLSRSAHAVHICNRRLWLTRAEYLRPCFRCEGLHHPAPTHCCDLITAPVGEYIIHSSTYANRCAAQIFAVLPSTPNKSFSQLVQTHLCHTMHASFKFIATLVFITSAFSPVFSAPFKCVLMFYYCNMADLVVVPLV